VLLPDMDDLIASWNRFCVHWYRGNDAPMVLNVRLIYPDAGDVKVGLWISVTFHLSFNDLTFRIRRYFSLRW
jgi:hypothetical protein